MAGLNATAGGGFDYIQSATPADPEKGELWYDTDGGTDGNGEAKVYDGSEWDPTGYVSHDQLTNVSAGDHFSPGSGLSFSSGALELLLSGYLTIDGNGDLAIASGSIGTDRLAFDTATQSELDGHAGDTANPHNVAHSQLSGVGSSDHHSRYTDSEAQSAVNTMRSHASGKVDVPSDGTEYLSIPTVTRDVPVSFSFSVNQLGSMGAIHWDPGDSTWDTTYAVKDTGNQYIGVEDTGTILLNNTGGGTRTIRWSIWQP